MALWQRITRGLSLKWALKQHGLLGSVRWLVLSVPYHLWLHLSPDGRRELAFDALNDVDTEGIVHASQLDIPVPLDQRREIIQYAPTRPRRFFQLLNAVPVDFSKFVFVDVGCGKGRALLLAERFPFKRIIGVEFSPALVEIARANVSRHCGRCGVICADACSYELPREPLLLYLSNPFTGSLFARFLSNVEASIRAHPRPVYVLYSTPVCEGQLAASSLFVRLASRQKLFALYAHVNA